jgi:hypothetical protein
MNHDHRAKAALANDGSATKLCMIAIFHNESTSFGNKERIKKQPKQSCSDNLAKENGGAGGRANRGRKHENGGITKCHS